MAINLESKEFRDWVESRHGGQVLEHLSNRYSSVLNESNAFDLIYSSIKEINSGNLSDLQTLTNHPFTGRKVIMRPDT